MSRIYVPSSGPGDWQRLLAEPCRQWATGFSAKTLARCWESADGLPDEIALMLKAYGNEVELLLAIPEYKVPLAGASRGESQNDVFALARSGGLTFAIAIEGKVREPFSQRLGDWLKNASEGKRERLASICRLLGLASPPESIYYQLLHRTASAVIEARRFKTDAAAMIVHSFSPERKWFEEFQQFASLFNVSVSPGELVVVRPSGTPPLYIGWACGDPRFLTD